MAVTLAQSAARCTPAPTPAVPRRRVAALASQIMRGKWHVRWTSPTRLLDAYCSSRGDVARPRGLRAYEAARHFSSWPGGPSGGAWQGGTPRSRRLLACGGLAVHGLDGGTGPKPNSWSRSSRVTVGSACAPGARGIARRARPARVAARGFLGGSRCGLGPGRALPRGRPRVLAAAYGPSRARLFTDACSRREPLIVSRAVGASASSAVTSVDAWCGWRAHDRTAKRPFGLECANRGRRNGLRCQRQSPDC